MTETVSSKEQLDRLLGELERMKEQIADVDIPGWIIGKPEVSEITNDLVIMVARSKHGELVPFYPPGTAEVVVAVLEGRIQITSEGSTTVLGRRSFLLAAGEHRTILPLEHPTRIYCTFFRTGDLSGAVAAR